MVTDYDEFPTQRAGDRSNLSIVVSHDLGDRTLVVVILLAIVIGACGLVMGMNLSKQNMQEQYLRDVAVKLQVNTNHVNELESLVKEKRNADQR